MEKWIENNDGQNRKEAIDLNTYRLQPEALKLIPQSTAIKYKVMPLSIEDNVLIVAMANVNDMLALQEMAAISKMRIAPVPADPEQIRETIDYNYKSYGEVEKQLNRVTPQTTIQRTVEDVSDAPVVRALDLIMNEAVKFRASDIHIEPQADRLRIRYRIDGVLNDAMSLPISAHPLLISRIKIMANMNIADHRPQDGQLTIKVRNQEIDVRVATINTIYGEMGSLRILDKTFAARTLTELGFSTGTLDKFQEMLKSPLGMILVCGPTGSGKTTTLYASINGLDRKSRKVITIEDPVEYRFPDIDQIQVNPKADLTFSNSVRAFMRHDPDVIMIGEIRDPDTAAMATQAALTGKLVLSSVHANDCVGSIFRLLDLGIGPFLISATVLCVVSQRMARRTCSYCRRPAKVSLEAQMAYFKETGDNKTEFLVGQGCNACAHTGYLGRVAISEIMVVDHELRNVILKGGNPEEIREAVKQSGGVSMWSDGMQKVKAGMTTPSEVLRNILYTG